MDCGCALMEIVQRICFRRITCVLYVFEQSVYAVAEHFAIVDLNDIDLHRCGDVLYAIRVGSLD